AANQAGTGPPHRRVQRLRSVRGPSSHAGGRLQRSHHQARHRRRRPRRSRGVTSRSRGRRRSASRENGIVQADHWPHCRSLTALPEGYSLNPSAYTHPPEALELSAIRDVAPLLQSFARYKSFSTFELRIHEDGARQDSLWKLSRSCWRFADRPSYARREPGNPDRTLWPNDRRTTTTRVLSEINDALRDVADDHAD